MGLQFPRVEVNGQEVVGLGARECEERGDAMRTTLSLQDPDLREFFQSSDYVRFVMHADDWEFLVDARATDHFTRAPEAAESAADFAQDSDEGRRVVWLIEEARSRFWRRRKALTCECCPG